MEWTALAVVGGAMVVSIACGAALAYLALRKPKENAESQLQMLSREYAHARRSWKDERKRIADQHRAQMDAVRSTAVDFEADGNYSRDAVRRLVNDIVSRTTPRNR